MEGVVPSLNLSGMGVGEKKREDPGGGAVPGMTAEQEASWASSLLADDDSGGGGGGGAQPLATVVKHSRTRPSSLRYETELLPDLSYSTRKSRKAAAKQEDSLEGMDSMYLKMQQKEEKGQEVGLRTAGRKSMRRANEEREAAAAKEATRLAVKQAVRKDAGRLRELNYHQALAKACFKDPCYEPEANYGIESRNAFFEWLVPPKHKLPHKLSLPATIPTNTDKEKVKGHHLRADIPDSIVWGLRSDGKPVWFFTASDGTVQQVPKVSNTDILDRLGNPNSPGALVAVCKRPATDRTGNDVDLMSSVELEELLNNPGVRRGLVCVQRYVKPKGSRASFIRAAWFSSHSQRAPKAWTLQNYKPFDDGAPEHVRRRRTLRDLADMFIVQSMKSRSCSVNEVKGVLVDEVARMNRRIAKYLALERGIILDELVADYIRDDTDRLWLLQVNAIRVQTVSKRCRIFGRLPGQEFTKPRNKPSSGSGKISQQSEEGEADGSGNKSGSAEKYKAYRRSAGTADGSASPRCSLTGFRMPQDDVAKMSAADMISLQDLRARRNSKPLHFLTTAAASARMVAEEDMDTKEATSKEAHDLLMAELKLERLQKEMNHLLGVPHVRCVLGHISWPETRGVGSAEYDTWSDSGTASFGLPSSFSSLSTEPSSHEPRATLPRTLHCYRLLVYVDSMVGLANSGLAAWIASATTRPRVAFPPDIASGEPEAEDSHLGPIIPGASLEVRLGAAFQVASIAHTFPDTEAAFENVKVLRAIYFFAFEEQLPRWLGGAALEVDVVDPMTDSSLARGSVPLSSLDLSAPPARFQHLAGLRHTETSATVMAGQAMPQVQLAASLEDLGYRRPRKGRRPQPHESLWIPPPGFGTHDALPRYWVELLSRNGGPDALTTWPALPTEACDISFDLEPSLNKSPPATPSPGPVAPDRRPDTSSAAVSPTDESYVEEHPVQALLGGLARMLDVAEGRGQFETAFSRVSEGRNVLEVENMGALLGELKSDAAPWERELFGVLVSADNGLRNEMRQEEVLDALLASAAALEDAEAADAEMAALAEMVAMRPAFELRQHWADGAAVSRLPSGGLNFSGLLAFLRALLVDAPTAVLRQLVMQLCLADEQGAFEISFDEFRAACEAVPIPHNLSFGPHGHSSDVNLASSRDRPAVAPVPGFLVLDLDAYTPPPASSSENTARGGRGLPVGQPLLLQVGTAPDSGLDLGSWQVGPLVVAPSGQFQMLRGDGTPESDMRCSLLDGVELQAGEPLPRLTLEILRADSSQLCEALARFEADEFGALLEELARKGVLQQSLQPGERGTCLQTDVPIFGPSARGEAESGAYPDECEMGVLTAIFEFEPYQTTPDASAKRVGAEESEARAAATANGVDAQALREWHERVEQLSPAADLLRSVGLDACVRPLCVSLGATRPADLAHFDLAFITNETGDFLGLNHDSWERLWQWLTDEGAEVGEEAANALQELIESLPQPTQRETWEVVDELRMDEARCWRSLEEVAMGRWIGPAAWAVLAAGASEATWEDLALMGEPEEVQSMLLDAGVGVFDARAMAELLRDYLKAQRSFDEAAAQRELAAEGFPVGNALDPTRAIEPIIEENSADLSIAEGASVHRLGLGVSNSGPSERRADHDNRQHGHDGCVDGEAEGEGGQIDLQAQLKPATPVVEAGDENEGGLGSDGGRVPREGHDDESASIGNNSEKGRAEVDRSPGQQESEGLNEIEESVAVDGNGSSVDAAPEGGDPGGSQGNPSWLQDRGVAEESPSWLTDGAQESTPPPAWLDDAEGKGRRQPSWLD